MHDEHHAGRDLVRNAASFEHPSVEHSCGPGAMPASIAPVLDHSVEQLSDARLDLVPERPSSERVHYAVANHGHLPARLGARHSLGERSIDLLDGERRRLAQRFVSGGLRHRERDIGT